MTHILSSPIPSTAMIAGDVVVWFYKNLGAIYQVLAISYTLELP